MLKSLKNCETEQIYHVTDPWDLSFIPENRDTDQKLVSQIMNAMRQNEYIFPIYITESGAVIDGQHRLKAFRNLAEEEPGKYFLRTIVINSNKSPIELAIIFNAFRKNWTTKDYLRSYVRQKLPSYIVLNEFLKKYPLLDIKAGIQLIKGSHSVETFQRGALSITIEEKEMAIDKAELLNQVYDIVKDKRVFRRDCILGFYRVYSKINSTSKFWKTFEILLHLIMRVWDSGWQRINTVFKSLLPELRSLIKVDKTPRAIIFGVEGLNPSVVPNFILFICLKNWKTILLVILKKKSKKIGKKLQNLNLEWL